MTDGEDRYRELLARALQRIDETEAALAAAQRPATQGSTSEPIAIVGASCRLPGGIASPEALLAALEARPELVQEVPPERWSIDDYYDPDPDAVGGISSRWGHFITDVDRFDPAFFGVTPREAMQMDPQHRLLLELAWHACEDAALPPADLRDVVTAAVIGISSHDYYGLGNASPDAIDAYSSSGTSGSVAAGRLAFTFGLRGPTMAIDTACSSSLVAVHQAAGLLRQHECDLAFAGGVHLMLTPHLMLMESRMHVLSPDGRCRPFDEAANGVVGGEGGGLLLLERLSDALAHGHRIRAIIPGSAVNHDGQSSGLTVPNGRAQAAVLRDALARAGIDGAAVGYVETHGSSTPLGDPIEAEAIGEVLGAGRRPGDPLRIGSIKGLVGHLGAAAGIAGLLRAMVSVEHGDAPPPAPCASPNRRIDWDDLNLTVRSERRLFADPDRTRIAGVSSFGFSGTNAHVLLQQPPEATGSSALAPAGPHLLALSATTDAALHEQARRHRIALEAERPELADVCRTANLGRGHLAHRQAFVAGTTDELIAQLEHFERTDADPAEVATGGFEAGDREPRVAFLFPGQGNQYGGMGAGLLDTEPVFADAIARCDALLGDTLPRSLVDLLRADHDDPELQRTSIAQPLLFSLGYALAECWQAWGVRPTWVLGHSAGEIAAACVAGALTLPDALTLAVERGRLMEGLPRDGAMALVSCAESVLHRHLDGSGVSISAFNGPDRWVIAGPADAVPRCADRLVAAGASVRMLTPDRAHHTPALQPIEEPLRAAAAGLHPSLPRCRFVSTLTGRVESEALLDPDYWVREAIEPVRFQQGAQTLIDAGCDVFVELGPSASLVSMLADWLPERAVALTSLKRDRDAPAHLLANVATLYRRGGAIDWRGWHAHRPGRIISLPGYAFARQRCWVDHPTADGFGAGRPTEGVDEPLVHPLLGRERSTALARAGQRLYEQALSARRPSYLRDHRVAGAAVFPATGYLEMVLAAGRAAFGTATVTVTDLQLDRMLRLDEDTPTVVQTVVEPVGDGLLEVQIFSGGSSARPWTRHAEARVARGASLDSVSLPSPVPVADDPMGDDQAVVNAHFERMQAQGLELGPRFRAVRSLALAADGVGVARVRLPAELIHERRATDCFHPVLLDSCLQAISLVIARETDETDGHIHLPTGIDRFLRLAEPTDELICHASVRPSDDGSDDPSSTIVDATIRNPDGAIVAVVEGVRLRSVPLTALVDHAPVDEMLYGVAWRELDELDEVDEVPGTDPSAGDGVLVLADDPETGAAFAAELRARGCDVALVPDGDDLAASTLAGPPRSVVCLNTGRPTDEHLSGDGWRDRTHRSSGRALAVVQHLARTAGAPSPTLWFVTAGARAVLADDTVTGLAHAPLWGLGQVVSREHPEMSCHLVDLDQDALAASLARLADDVVAAPRRSSAGPLEDRVAHRRGRRFGERVIPIAAPSPGVVPLALDPDGAYLVTGGLAGLGLATAEWLVGRGARHLTLVGRSAPSAATVATVEALRATGAEVDLCAADVADEDALAALLQDRRDRGQPWRGVIHSAGLLRDATIENQTWERFEEVYRPKVDGGWLLDRLTADDPLDFFVLYSSAVTMLGAAGQSSHSAASAFLDGLAHHRAARGRPALSVDWGPWGAIGAAARLDSTLEGRGLDTAARMDELGMTMLDRHVGFAALERLLAAGVTRAAVLPIRWSTFVGRAGRSALHAEVETMDASGGSGAAGGSTTTITGSSRPGAERLAALPEGRRRIELERLVQSAVSRRTGLAPDATIDPTARFGDLGIDSLMAVEVRNELARGLGRPLRSTLLFDYPSVEALTRYLGVDVLGLWTEDRPADEIDEANGVDALDALDDLDDDALAALVDQELSSWQGPAPE